MVSKFNVGDRVKIVSVVEGDEDMMGLEGTVVEGSAVGRFLFDVNVLLDSRPERLDVYPGKFDFFFDDELELVK